MPVTARLSRRFYEQFGDELASELVDWLNGVDATYRSDLERLNELNFARFDAKLEQRLAQMDAKWEQRFTQIDAKWEQRFTQSDAKWEQRFVQMDAKWEQRLALLDASFEKRLVTGLAALRTDLIRWMFAFWSGTLLALAGFLFAILMARPSP
jgi:hypothetical protein